MKSIPDAVTKDDCLIRNPRPFIGEGAPLYGHTFPNDEVKETDQKVSGTIREEGIETRSEGIRVKFIWVTCQIFKLILNLMWSTVEK